MKRILIFVVISLTTFSIVNAVNIPLRKRVTTFTACKGGAPEFNGAIVDPDPPVPGKTATAKFSIALQAPLESGKIVTDATDAGGESIGGGFPKDQDVCTLEGVTCPIATGSTIDFQAPLEIPDDAPDTYTLQYSLVDGTGKEIACSSGPVTGAPKGGDAKGPGGDGKAPPDEGDAKGPGDDGKAPPDEGDAKGPGGDGKAPPDEGDAKGPGGDGKAPPDGDDGGDGGPPGPP